MKIQINMQIIIFFLSLLACGSLAADHCYNDVVSACSPVGGEFQNCNAKYGAINDVVKELQNYVNVHIARNFQFMLISAHFANYEKQREGLHKLFKKYSDKTWEDGIDLIKFVTKRGGMADFKYKKQTPNDIAIENYEFHELGSLSRGLDMWKHIAEEAHYIHGEVLRRRDASHDPEIASYIEEKFVHEHADIIRDLAGHTNDLKKMMADASDPSLALFLFDNYLSK